MATYNGWTVVTMPGTPPAPQSVDFIVVDAVSLSVSPFTGQQQVHDWAATWMEAKVTMPPMIDSVAQEWIAFFRSCNGVANVFQFPAGFSAAYPNSIGSRYWRLKTNSRQWSINVNKFYGIQFDIREAL